MTVHLPTEAHWFAREVIDDRITRIDEPYAHEFLRANIWHVRGASRDLIVDAGLGVASLRASLPEVFEHDPILVITHAHLDHMGSAYEFSDRRAHPAEPLHAPRGTSIYGSELGQQLGADDLPELLITARPPGFDPEDYRLRGAAITQELLDGDTVDLGDSKFVVMHLPGHTPGSICLFEEGTGILFSGDVVYDDTLLDELHESNVDDYAKSMLRLKELPVTVVHPGHGRSFSAFRLHEIIDAYLSARPG